MGTTFPRHDFDTSIHDETLPFKIHTFDPENVRAQATYPHRHSFYELVYLTGGSGVHILDFEAYAIEPPVLYFISAGQVHFWRNTTPLQGYGLLFSPDFLLFDAQGADKLSLFHAFYSHLKLTADQLPPLETLFQALYREYQAQEMNFASVLSAYLHILLTQIQRWCASADTLSTDLATSRIQFLRQLVREQCGQEHSVKYYADQMGVSADYLTEQVKTLTGYTASQIIRQELLLEAKRLLINTDLTVQQISYQLRFDDPAYFGRFFRRESQMSPKQFRQVIREKYQISSV